MQTIRDAFWASRPISWINTAAPFFLGYVLGAGRIDAVALIGTLYFLIPYNVMLYGVNDIFDYESDIKNPRKGSVEGAVLAKARHRRLWGAIIITNVPFIVYLFTLGDPVTKLWLAFLIFMNLAYSLKGLRFKEIPFLDSFTSSTHFFSPLVYGLLLAGSATLYPAALAAFVLWGLASHAFGAVQDIVYDRQAGIGSIGTVTGTAFTIRFCVALYLLAAILPALSYGWLGLLVLPFLALYALNVGRYLRIRDDKESPVTNRGWRNFLWLNILCGFWITQLLIMAFNPFGLSPSELSQSLYALLAIGAISLVLATGRILSTTRLSRQL